MSSSNPKVEPTLRDGVEHELKAALLIAIERFVAKEGQRTCLTCILFRENGEMCIKHDRRPPARVIAYGCADYAHDDELPF